MKKLSLQWRITLMTTVLICITCVLMNCLIGFSGKQYMYEYNFIWRNS